MTFPEQVNQFAVGAIVIIVRVRIQRLVKELV